MTGTGTVTCTTKVTTIALCTLCSQAKNHLKELKVDFCCAIEAFIE